MCVKVGDTVKVKDLTTLCCENKIINDEIKIVSIKSKRPSIYCIKHSLGYHNVSGKKLNENIIK